MVKKSGIAAAVFLALVLAGCASSGGSSQDVSHNALGQQVDPKTGLPLPGGPPIGGGY